MRSTKTFALGFSTALALIGGTWIVGGAPADAGPLGFNFRPIIRNVLPVQTLTFGPGDCPLDPSENCVDDDGARRLLRWDTVILNDGGTDAVVSEWVGSPPKKKQSNQFFVWAECHHHHHLKEFTAYELLADANGQPGGLVLTGRKQAFCLEDTERHFGTAKAKFTCKKQGITAGWADVYGSHLDCQWLDVTGVAPGTYWLRVSVDTIDQFPETDEGDNSHEVQVVIQ